MSIQTVNPNDNKLVKSFEEMTDKAVYAPVTTAEEAFTKWRKTIYLQCAELLNKVAQLMRRKRTYWLHPLP